MRCLRLPTSPGIIICKKMATTARETAEILLQIGRFVHAVGYRGAVNPAQWMALRLQPRQFILPHALGICGISGHDPRHGLDRHQGAQGRRISDPRAVKDRPAKRSAAIDGQGQQGARTRSVYGSGRRRGHVRRGKEIHHPCRARSGTGIGSRAYASSAVRRLPELPPCPRRKSSDPAGTCALALVCGLHRSAIRADELNLLCAYFQPAERGRFSPSTPGRRPRISRL